jgi:hypothetical protein
MADFHKPGIASSRDRIAILHGILQRFAQAENPLHFVFVKQLLVERITELEAGVEHAASEKS